MIHLNLHAGFVLFIQTHNFMIIISIHL